MSDEKKEKMEIHFYDGIEEHDHPIPTWFSAFFIGGVLFGILYYCYFELWGGKSLNQEYTEAMTAQRMLRSEVESRAPKASEDELFALVKDPESKKVAQVLFTSKCASCHGAEGQGGIGPNLTDAYWIHGATLMEIRKTIMDGVLDKGMPPWGGMLKPEEVNALAAFMRGFQGTHPAGAKEPQGVLVKVE